LKSFTSSKTISIFWVILRQHLVASFGTVLALVATILAGSLFIVNLSPWQQVIEDYLGIGFFSRTFFILLALLILAGFVVSLFFTIFLGYPLGRELRKKLQEITEGAEAFSRGRLDYRINLSGFTEIVEVGWQFNQMADRLEKQVNSLQRLIDENVRLVKQTKYSSALDERRKLARELHDAVSQQLFAVAMILAALPKQLERDPLLAKKSLQQVEEMVVNAQQELRALIMHLRPITLAGVSLKEGVEQLFAELSEKYPNISWELILKNKLNLSEGVEDQLFRVIQEGISNMLRHAKATLFRMRFIQKQERIILLMEDNGIGFELGERKKSSYGLETMRERIEGIGGRLDLISYPEKGTRIEVRLPIKQRGEDYEQGD